MNGLRFSKTLVAINGGVPLARLAWDAFRGTLGADPINYAIRTTGLLSLIFLLLSLTVTPVRRITGWNKLVSYRRSLGLYGFAYACVHLGIYVGFDRAMNLGSALQEIWNRRYLQVGLAGVLLMVPLAITSTDAMIRRLGPRRWKALHRLAYLAAAAGSLHYYMQVKSDVRQPLVFAGILAALLLFRAVWHYIDLRRTAARAKPSDARGFAVIPSSMAKAASVRKFWSGELRVARSFDETPEVRTFRLTPVDGDELPFDYRPGQYLTLRLTVDGKAVNRSYTISSSPSRRGYCELTVKREEMGVSSKHLHRTVREGDRLKIAAPAGRFVFFGSESESVVLIAGGVGITPLMSILRYLTDHCWLGEIYFLFATRGERDIIFRDEIEQLKRRFPNLHVCITLSRVEPDGAWTGERGRITPALLTRFVPELQRRAVYLCGPNDMMASVRQMLAELGVPDLQVKTEAFVAATSAVNDNDREAARDDGSPGGTANAAEDPTASPSLGTDERTITFTKSDRDSMIVNGTTVLEAAEAVGVDIPFECRAGVCGQCKTKLLAGTVSMASEDALSPAEKSAGWILACQASATSAMVSIEA